MNILVISLVLRTFQKLNFIIAHQITQSHIHLLIVIHITLYSEIISCNVIK
jgi:hypothetical protein